MTQRKFRPRKRLPKEELIDYLKKGYTLQEIADHYGVAVSYVSEYLKMLKIDLRTFKGRDAKMKVRKKQNAKNKTFISEFYKLIEGEVTNAR